MSRMLTLLTGAALLGSVGLASAAQPVALNDAQMDQVAAGFLNILSTNAAVVAQQAGSAAYAGNSLVNLGTLSIAGSTAGNNAVVTQF